VQIAITFGGFAFDADGRQTGRSSRPEDIQGARYPEHLERPARRLTGGGTVE
jgi:hypothetical protein